ncbi:hypothetical protein EGW08_022431, partial [Elysia chlorotica]
CLDEGLVPVCFERTAAFGGLWRYTDIPGEGQGCVMKSTVINVSKEMMSYSDFPTPRESPVFMHNTQVLHYFKKYTEHFNLEKHIVYNTEVLWVTKAGDFSKSGQWSIRTRDVNSSEKFCLILLHVTFPHHPTHTRSAHWYITHALVKLLINNSHCFNPHTHTHTQYNYNYGIRAVNKSLIPLLVSCTNCLGYQGFDKAFTDVPLQPRYGPLHQHPMVNDDMPNRILCGAVQVKTDVSRFTRTGVQFVDGTAESDIDLVVLATGYSFGFPFVDKELIDVQDNQVHLYRNVFPPDLSRHTMAFIGCVQPFGAVCPVAEMQCRAAVRVFKVSVKISIGHSRSVWQIFIGHSRSSVPPPPPPPPGHLLKTDPLLALKVFFGPFTPYQYRLYGPGRWSGARAAINEQWGRTFEPLKTKSVPVSENMFWSQVFRFVVIITAMLFFRWLVS